MKMAKSFAERGRTNQNVRMYQKLDKQVKELGKGAATKVGKKKYGYMCNPYITLCGWMLILYKMMPNYRSGKAPPIKALINRAATLKVDLVNFDELT